MINNQHTNISYKYKFCFNRWKYASSLDGLLHNDKKEDLVLIQI